MSRVGKNPIELPQGVSIKIDGDNISVSGPKGELSLKKSPVIGVVQEDSLIKVFIDKETKDSNALWGLTRSLIANMVEGVSKGFEKKLEIEGVGYSVELKGNKLFFAL